MQRRSIFDKVIKSSGVSGIIRHYIDVLDHKAMVLVAIRHSSCHALHSHMRWYTSQIHRKIYIDNSGCTHADIAFGKIITLSPAIVIKL